MALQIGQRPDHGFDQPLGLLSDCHRRIEHFLTVLVAVEAEAAGGALTSAHRDALEAALRYFAVAAPRHTADEEESLFPRLRTTDDAGVSEALALVTALERDHDEADEQHAVVDSLGRRWLTNGRLAPSESAELRDRLSRLQSLYRRHIAVEDEQVFPAAARVLDAAQIHEIGQEMAARRRMTPETVAVIRTLRASAESD